MNPSSTRPSAAERACTVLTHALPIMVDLGHLGSAPVGDESPVMLLIDVDEDLPDHVAELGVPCTVQAALVSPVPGPDRILDRVLVTGHAWPTAERAVADSGTRVTLRVNVTTMMLNDEPVDLDEYFWAEPDPLAGCSDEFVEHLVRGHAAELLQLAHLFEPTVLQGVRAFAPVRVDRLGLTFRIDRVDGSTTERLNFRHALSGPDELQVAMGELRSRAQQVPMCPFSGQPRSVDPQS